MSRAGLHRQNPRRDANEAPIVDALRQCGYLVWRLSDANLPDLLVLDHRGKRWVLLEVKAPPGPRGGRSAGALRPGQETFSRLVGDGAPLHVVRTLDEALDVLKARHTEVT